jgi:phage-related minor tail protein
VPEVDLNFISRQLDRLITEVASLRDEVHVQGAMLMRLDSTVAAVLVEQRAMREQVMRMAVRISKLEDSAG